MPWKCQIRKMPAQLQKFAHDRQQRSSLQRARHRSGSPKLQRQHVANPREQVKAGQHSISQGNFFRFGSYRFGEEGTPPVGPFSACDFSRKPSPKVHSCAQRISFSHPARARSGSSPERHFLHEISSRSAILGNVRAAHWGRRKPRRRFCLGQD